jgi:hypothetical protein
MTKAKLSMWGMALALVGSTVGVLGGCGSGEDSGTAVKESPLTGSVAAQPFTAKSALATPESDGTSVTIYDKEVTCADRFRAGSGTQILLRVDSWKDGYSYQLGGSIDTPFGIPLPKYSVTFVTNGSSNTIVSKGRVEVVKASSKGAPGILRLRADGGSSGSIEGQVAVTHCGE